MFFYVKKKNTLFNEVLPSKVLKNRESLKQITLTNLNIK